MEHVFASEASGKLGVHQKNMMMLNCKPPPQVIYEDVLVCAPVTVWHGSLIIATPSSRSLLCSYVLVEARDASEGLDWLSGQKVKVPVVHLYTGGFECQECCKQVTSISISLKSRALILLAPGFIWHEQFPQRIVPHHHREVRGPDHQIRP